VVWPGDISFRRTPSVDFQSGSNFLLSSIQTTVHLGAHVDAPNHYHPDGNGISKQKLDYYLGPCQVFSVVLPRGERIRPVHLKDRNILTDRILFKTGSFPNPNLWNPDFNSLSPELVELLASQGVILLGIDTPSVDPFDDNVLESHMAMYRNQLAILEGIVLRDVPEGIYQLIALPLKIRDADASPVRAILIEESSN